jgi:3-oxoacyl-[acyl-carrier-protein] synthase II
MLKGFTRPRRVVITGMGCVTPLGIGREAYWQALLAGKSGIRRIETFDPSSFPVQIAAEVPSFDWQAQLNPKDRKHVPRTVPLALAAAREALEDARLFPQDLSLDERRAFGVELGTGGGGLAFTEQQYEYWYVGPTNKASVYTIPSSTHGGLSSELSMAFGLRGLSHIVSTGCTSSTDAIAYATQHIALGRQDLMLAGGVDAPIAPGILAAFNLMTVLTNEWNAEPHRASRPFSRNRSGMVLGEGSWIYVLEELNRAMDRGAQIYAEITGYGATCDAYHRVRLAEDGDEPARAMRIETSALKRAFDGHAARIPMSATKSQIGHPQGASGAAGLGATLCAMHTNRIPPTINLDDADPDCDLDYVPNEAREANVKTALCNCIGFGSKNSALVVQKLVET